MCPSEGWDFKQARGPHKQYYYPVGGGESGYIAQHPKNLDWFYAGSQGALLTKFDRKTGFNRDIQVYPRFSLENLQVIYLKGGNGLFRLSFHL